MDASVGVDCIGDKLIPEFRGTVGGLLGKLWGTFGEILGGLTGLILGFWIELIWLLELEPEMVANVAEIVWVAEQVAGPLCW